jgi:hypothetical protein
MRSGRRLTLPDSASGVTTIRRRFEMPRRVIVTTNELFIERLFGKNTKLVLHDTQVDHLFGGVKIIVEDPEAPPVPEGNIPINEPLA